MAHQPIRYVLLFLLPLLSCKMEGGKGGSLLGGCNYTLKWHLEDFEEFWVDTQTRQTCWKKLFKEIHRLHHGTPTD